MRVQCRHCNAVARITASKLETAGLRTLYVACEACGAQQVWQLSYCHDTLPPHVDFVRVADEVLQKLSPEERQAVLDRYRAPAQPILLEGGRHGR